MANVDLAAGKAAVNTLKEAQNIGKQLGGVITDQQADMERAVQEQHRKRMQAKAQQELMLASQDFKAYEKYEAEKKHQREIDRLRVEAINKYGKNAWTEIEAVKARLKREHDEEVKFMDSDRYKMAGMFWWCMTAAALVTYFFKLYK